MLTRNLYRRDEVRAAATWSLLRGRQAETAFWLSELSAAEAVTVLRTSWLFGIGMGGLGWCRALTEPEDPVQLGIAMARAARTQRDCSVVAILGLRRVAPDRVAAVPVPPGVTGDHDMYVARAILQGKTATAWLCATSWDLLKRVGEWKHGEEFWEIITAVRAWAPAEAALAFAVGAACMRRAAWRTAMGRGGAVGEPAPEVVDEMSRWVGLQGRARRHYTIPVECLYGLAPRGWLDPYSSTETEIMETASLEAGLGDVPSEDSDREDYYDARFPDDIPDEWPSADRQKSHGRGVNNEGGVCRRWRVLDRWFGRGVPSCVLWRGALAEPDKEELVEKGASFSEIIGGDSAEAAGSWNYRPARRILEPS